jgi:hypothetical protein
MICCYWQASVVNGILHTALDIFSAPSTSAKVSIQQYTGRYIFPFLTILSYLFPPHSSKLPLSLPHHIELTVPSYHFPFLTFRATSSLVIVLSYLFPFPHSTPTPPPFQLSHQSLLLPHSHCQGGTSCPFAKFQATSSPSSPFRATSSHLTVLSYFFPFLTISSYLFVSHSYNLPLPVANLHLPSSQF